MARIGGKNTKVVKIKVISELWSENLISNTEKGISNIEHRISNFEVGAFSLRITTECLAYPAISVFGVRYSVFDIHFLRLVLGLDDFLH
jgi:hypothetical protein